MATAQQTIAIYQAVLQRAPTDAELAAFVANSQTAEGQQTQIDLLVNSSEANDFVAPIVRLYQATFGRVPDADGLDFWSDALRAQVQNGASAFDVLTQINAGFAASTEFATRFPSAAADGMVDETFLTDLYQQTFQRDPSDADKEFYIGKTIAATLSAFAQSSETINDFRPYVDLFLNKAASGTQDYQQSLLDANDDGTVDQSDVDTINNAASEGSTFTLTTGVDSIVGTAGNDTITATNTSAAPVLGSLDSVDGGAGTDSLLIADTATATGADFSLPAGFTITNVENLSITTNGAIGTAGGTAFDVSGISGLASFTGAAAGAGTGAGSNVKAAGTTNVNLTVAGDNTATVSGGKAVAINAGLTSTGAVGVSGKDLTSVSVKGGGAVTIDNLGGAAGTTTSVGTTMTSVTLDNVAGATAAVKGAAIDTVTVKNQDTALATTLTNGTSTSLTVNVDGAGYNAAGAAVAGVSVAAGSKAETINVNATGSKSNVTVSGSAAKTVNIAGSADLILAPVSTATAIDGSTATGGLTLGTLAAGTTSVKTGAGADKFTLSATAKATVDTGAGNDTVTLGSALAAGSTVNLGAGDDKLLKGAGSVATSTSTAKTVIDAGDGVDTVSAALINAGNAGQFANFESLDISAAANLDVALVTGSTITGLTLTGTAGNSTVSNVATGVGLTVSGDNTGGTHTINVKDAGTATDNSFAITFAGADATTAPTAATVKAGTTILNGIETINIASDGGANTWNSIAVTDDKLQVLSITGDKNLDLAFLGTNGTNASGNAGGAVKLIDGSSATGKLNINTTNVTADDKAGVGLTVKGGSANDTITLAQKATVDGGAGDDTITSAAAGGSFTGGDGKDVFDVKAAVGNVTTVTDFLVGADKLTFADNGNESFTATKVDISAATNLAEALDLAAAGNGGTNSVITWFQYGADTYVVEDNSAGGAFVDTADIAVKLTGTVDLSTLTIADFNFA